MSEPLEYEISVEEAKSSMPFPAMEDGEFVIKVVLSFSKGIRTNKFFTNKGRLLTTDGGIG